MVRYPSRDYKYGVHGAFVGSSTADIGPTDIATTDIGTNDIGTTDIAIQLISAFN